MYFCFQEQSFAIAILSPLINQARQFHFLLDLTPFPIFIQGDVIPTAGGGRQIIFNDVEVLRQKSPERLPTPRKRSRSPKKRSYEEFRGVGGVGARIAAMEDRMNAGEVTSKKYRV